MLDLFKKKIDVERSLEMAVLYMGDYFREGDMSLVHRAFLLVSDVYIDKRVDEHVKSKLKELISKYDYLIRNGYDLYDGFLYTCVSVINYCILYIGVGKLS